MSVNKEQAPLPAYSLPTNQITFLTYQDQTIYLNQNRLYFETNYEYLLH